MIASNDNDNVNINVKQVNLRAENAGGVSNSGHGDATGLWSVRTF